MRMRTTGFQRLIYTSSLWFLSAVFDQFHAGLTLPVQFCSLLMNVCPVWLVQKDKLSVCDKSFVWTLIIINDKKLLGRNYKHFGPEQEEAEKIEQLSSLLLAKQHLSLFKVFLNLLQIEHCFARGTMESSVAFLYQINCMAKQTSSSKCWPNFGFNFDIVSNEKVSTSSLCDIYFLSSVPRNTWGPNFFDVQLILFYSATHFSYYIIRAPLKKNVWCLKESWFLLHVVCGIMVDFDLSHTC